MDKVLNRIATAEVADVFQFCLEDFPGSNHLCHQQQKAFNDINIAGHPIWAGISISATTVGINSRHTTSRFPGQAMPPQTLS